MDSQSRILVIGATGYIGKFVVEASAKAGHPTFALVRQSTLSDPSKAPLIEKYINLGINCISGDLNDHESLVKKIKLVDVVISTLGFAVLEDQLKIISAIKEAGNVKRFFPSEFAGGVDHLYALDPAKTFLEVKLKIRQAIEAQGIPYTYIVSYFFADFFLPNLCQWGAKSPPRDKVVIMGDGNQKVVFAKEEDVAAFTIKAVDDPRALNKTLYIRPRDNIYSLNELVSLWESKIGKTLERIYQPEDLILKNIQESVHPVNVFLSIFYAFYVKGDHTNFQNGASFGVEASELYPDVKYATVNELIDRIV